MWYFVLQASLRSSQRLRLMVTVTSISTAFLLFISPPLWVAPKWGHRTQEPASLWTTQPMSKCFSAIPSINDPEETDLWDSAEELNWELPVIKLIEKCFQIFLLLGLFFKHPYNNTKLSRFEIVMEYFFLNKIAKLIKIEFWYGYFWKKNCL